MKYPGPPSQLDTLSGAGSAGAANSASKKAPGTMRSQEYDESDDETLEHGTILPLRSRIRRGGEGEGSPAQISQVFYESALRYTVIERNWNNASAFPSG
jgi:hypothetical protein